MNDLEITAVKRTQKEYKTIARSTTQFWQRREPGIYFRLKKSNGIESELMPNLEFRSLEEANAFIDRLKVNSRLWLKNKLYANCKFLYEI